MKLKIKPYKGLISNEGIFKMTGHSSCLLMWLTDYKKLGPKVCVLLLLIDNKISPHGVLCNILGYIESNYYNKMKDRI